MRRGPLFWLLVVLGGALLLEVAFVLTVSASPRASERARGALESTRAFVFGDAHSRNVLERVGTGAGDVLSEVRDVIAGEMVSGDTATAVPNGTKGQGKFAKCLSCHADYATKVRFTSALLDHAQHAELGVGCADCHTDTAHPNPEPPSEEGCSKCHDEVERQDGCPTCHPPGSLPHFYELGFPRDGMVECDSCHPSDAFETTGGGTPLPVIDPSNRDTCTSCHEPQTCNNCHGEGGPKAGGRGPHPPGWVPSGHGQEALGTGGTECANCHETASCVDACHSDPSKMDQLLQGAQE